MSNITSLPVRERLLLIMKSDVAGLVNLADMRPKRLISADLANARTLISSLELWSWLFVQSTDRLSREAWSWKSACQVVS